MGNWKDMSTGDKIGAIGSAAGSFLELGTTIANMMNTKPNVNHFANYGERTLTKLDQAKDFARSVLGQQLDEAQLSKTTTQRSFRNTARGINQLRAGDLVIGERYDNNVNNIYNQYYQRDNAINNQEANIMLNQDQVKMRGEAMADTANRQDKDAFYTNLGQNFADMSTSAQRVGALSNQQDMNKFMYNILNQMSPYIGIGEGGRMYNKNDIIHPMLAKTTNFDLNPLGNELYNV